MATKGHYAGTIQVVDHPKQEAKSVMLWSIEGAIFTANLLTSEEMMDAILADVTEDSTCYVGWLDVILDENT